MTELGQKKGFLSWTSLNSNPNITSHMLTEKKLNSALLPGEKEIAFTTVKHLKLQKQHRQIIEKKQMNTLSSEED